MVAFKSRSSDLRTLLKVFKQQFDDLSKLRRYEPAVKRLLFMGSPQDIPWTGEALHRLALMYEASDDVEEAAKHYVQSLDTFADHEWLARARAMRDYGLFMARTSDLEFGMMQIKQALALHDEDLKFAKGHKQQLKGERQRRITESYVLRVRLLVNKKDRRAREWLIDFALADCRDCCLRDQQQVIEFLLTYVTSGAHRAQLEARLVEINYRRRKTSAAVKSMAKLVIGINLTIARRAVRTTIRKG